jgi:ATP-dependent DNA helicase RecG
MIPSSENVTTEFKTSFSDEVIISLVAFSNAKGGSVYIGVNDRADVNGVEIGKETIQNWINEVKNKTAPQIIPDVEELYVEEKKVVVLSVTEYPIKPVSIKGRYYKRVRNSNHLMSTDEISNEHLKTLNASWDYYADPHHTIKHISVEKISRFVKMVEGQSQREIEISDNDYLNKLEVFRQGKLTFGGYLLFVGDYCPISDVQVGRFKSDITIIDSISLNTDLFSEVDEIIAFIRKHLMVEYIITGEPQRTERFDYPPDAIREIVINMIVHRDYRDSSASIIKIFDDRIEFYNPGKLYGGNTVDDLLTGNYTSISRNKLIARVFKEAGLIERYGSGIIRIHKICRDYGIKEPEYKEISQGFQVILFKEKLDLSEKNSDNTVVGVEKISQENGKKTARKRQENGKKIIDAVLADSQISINELAEKLGVSVKTIRTNIEKLKNEGIIQRIGPNKGGYWEIIEKD